MKRAGKLNKLATLGIIGKGLDSKAQFEVVTAEPDYIRDAVCAALSSLPPEQRSSVVNRLLKELKTAGVRVRESLLLLGASARTTDELTAPELAALIRYIRLTKPMVMTAVAEPLRELLSMANRDAHTGKAA
jgi:hypothetical protein